MINETAFKLGAAPSAIREIFAYGLERKKVIGAENVFDFSLGNPSVPTPQAVSDALRGLTTLSSEQLHGYTPAQGTMSCRSAIADNLNKRFGTNYNANNFYMTMGAAASLNCTLTALLCEGDEVIVIAPYFPEYRMWIENAHARCVQVDARENDFQIDCEALDRAITARTKAIIINTPNNPVGVIYSEQNLLQLAAVLEARQAKNGQPIYLISDEPYRELVYDGLQTSWIPEIYPNTIVCYSWSKSFSLPGERIGYVLVPDTVLDAKRVYVAICGAGRALGYVCAPALFQHLIERCVDVQTDVSLYDHNRQLLCGILSRLGYTFIEPQGAFYLWVKALEKDANAFAEMAQSLELLLVPSDSFGVKGWVRISYCVAPEVIERSAEAFKLLKERYDLS